MKKTLIRVSGLTWGKEIPMNIQDFRFKTEKDLNKFLQGKDHEVEISISNELCPYEVINFFEHHEKEDEVKLILVNEKIQRIIKSNLKEFKIFYKSAKFIVLSEFLDVTCKKVKALKTERKLQVVAA